MHILRTLTFLGLLRDVTCERNSRNPRISISRSSDSISVSWQTDDPVFCDNVRFGLSEFELSRIAVAERNCNIYKGDVILHATLSDLDPSTQYYYRPACSGALFSFRTPPSMDLLTSFSLGVFADLGPIDGQASTERLAQLSVNGYIFAGDIGYADDAFMHASSYVSRLNEFLDTISPISSRVPIMVVPGNHEAEDHTPVCLLSPACRNGYGNFSAYNCVWNNPRYDDRHHSMWYSFDYGPVHFVMTNTETDYDGAPLEPYGEVGFIPTGKFGRPGEYEAWLKQDLESTPTDSFIIVVGHRPISVMNDKTDPYVTPLNSNIISLINSHADAYLSGHVHYYTRSIPKLPNLATLISVGGAGCDEWDQRTIQDTREGETAQYQYFAYGDEQTVGILNYNSSRPHQLEFEIIRSRDGGIVDTVTINKRHRDRKYTVPESHVQ
jgi:hypothetical protein